MLPAGTEPETEKQVERVSTLSLVKRDTALFLRDFRQGASNWIHSLLDSNRGSAAPSTATETPPESADARAAAGVYSCECEVGTLDVGGFPVSKFPFKLVFDHFCVPRLQLKGLCVIHFSLL